MRCAIVHYHELALKGRNREYFEKRLVRNIQWTLKDLGIRRVENLRSRIRVVLPDAIPDQTIIERLTRVFGIANFSMAHGLPLDLAKPDLGSLGKAIIEALRSESFSTFRVSVKRADKRLALTSMEVARDIGAAICKSTGKKVSLKDPDITVYLELLSKEVYYATKKIQGSG
jgi:thiamine biosynthesis protein ThiI